MVPARCSCLCRKSSLVFSASETISSARRRRSIPSSVRMIRCLLRRNSVTPSSSSSCIICLDRVGWVKCSRLAAFVIFSSRATIRKYFKTRISMIKHLFTRRIPRYITKINMDRCFSCLICILSGEVNPMRRMFCSNIQLVFSSCNIGIRHSENVPLYRLQGHRIIWENCCGIAEGKGSNDDTIPDRHN